MPGATRVIGASVQAPSPTLRLLSTARRTSWPSAKTSAATTTTSPGVRLMGNLPPSISGVSASITTRDGGFAVTLPARVGAGALAGAGPADTDAGFMRCLVTSVHDLDGPRPCGGPR